MSKVITKSSLLQDLEDGLTRQEMAEKYETTKAAIAKGIKMLGLENSKPKKKLDVTFVDDTVITEQEFETVTISQEQIDQKIEEMSEIVDQEQSHDSIMIDEKEELFGISSSNIEHEEIQDPIESSAQEITFESLGFNNVSPY